MTRWLIAGLAIAVVPFAVAQDATRHLTVAVLDADTGQPIEGARLQLFGVSRVPFQQVVFTGKDGLFDAVIPVDWRAMVQASAEGYIAENSRVFPRCSPCDATFRLRANVAFTGRVVAADSAEPVMRVQVDAFPFVSGQLSKSSIGRVWTDSAGAFSLEQLPAGQYFLHFTPADSVASLNLGGIEDQQSRRLRAEWWPGGADWQQASPVAVTRGSSLRLPDIRLSPDARVTVSGTLLPQYCRGGESFKVTISRSTNGTSNMLRSALVRCGAQYAFSDLTSGSYVIAMDGGAGHDLVSVDVQVQNENVRADLPGVARAGVSGLP